MLCDDGSFYCGFCAADGFFMVPPRYDRMTGSALFATCAECGETYFGLDYICAKCRSE